MVLPVARTNAEAHLYMDLHPCTCGESRFPRAGSVVDTPDGPASRYAGRCLRDQVPREFVFRLPAETAPPPVGATMSYGGPESSLLIDPGEWLGVADRYADLVPADVDGLDPDATARARVALRHAVAAVDEVLKFIPAGVERVPAAAFVSTRGRAAFVREPGRFRRDRLAALRRVYADLADRI